MATLQIQIQPGDIVQDYWGSQGMVDRVYESWDDTPQPISMGKNDWLEAQFPPINDDELAGSWASVVHYSGGHGLSPVSRLLKCKTEQGLARPYLPILN